MVKDMKAALSKEIHGGSWKATGNWSEIVNINNINKIIKSTIMDVCLKSSLATGNFGSGKIGGPNKVGVSQVLNRLNYSATLSHLRRISTPIEKTGKLIAPRKQHGSQWGMCCPCETPEGHGVGVIKNMSVTATVSIFSSPVTVYVFLQNLGRLLSLKEATVAQLHHCTRVFLNGSWIGVLHVEHTEEVVEQFRQAKRAGKIHRYTGIVWKNALKELWVTTEAGRILRPLYYGAAVREVMADASGLLRSQLLGIHDWNQLLLWQSPSGHHLVEYVDAGETDTAYIAMDYPSCAQDARYTHCEIHPSVIFGTTASYIPFPDHNQSPRNAYQSSMGKQAMGIYSLNFRQRFDAMAHVLCYPEKPMVSSYMSRTFGTESLPAGQNVIVAIMTYTGYNQEDSNMINRAALDRGRFRSIFYRTYKDEERKNQSSGEEEKFCRPDPTETKHMKNAHYEKVADDGFIPKDTYVTPDDILIGKVVPLRLPTGAVLPAGAKKSRDVSKMPRNNESGYVDKIYKNRNGEGYSFVKIRMRQDRVPEIGDKFCLTADHDVLTRERGWVPIPEVTMEDEVAQLNRETGAMEYVHPLETLMFDQDGEMYEVKSQGVSLKTTLNHRMWVQRRGRETYELVEAWEVVGEAVHYLSPDAGALLVDSAHGKGTETITLYSGKVYCLRVPTEVFLVRRNGRAVWTGNSSRHGQKGTMGMILNPEDMPQTASGIIPDIIINPHAIPSRMTIAQLMETLMSKIGCMAGCQGDGTPFGETTVEDLAGLLRDQYGMEPYGNEIMYNGYTGRMMETSIFIGPCYYQRLRHCSADKMHSRASGPLVMLTRQPAEGRAREGGLRAGEMERDCIVGHGMADFMKERFMECSDQFSCYTCKDCGLLAVVNPEKSIWVCHGCGNTTNFAHIHIPYATKLLLQELETMNIGSRLITQQKLITHQK
jgi:DNA-directed RNA polymerase II subunit RPB2